MFLYVTFMEDEKFTTNTIYAKVQSTLHVEILNHK